MRQNCTSVSFSGRPVSSFSRRTARLPAREFLIALEGKSQFAIESRSADARLNANPNPQWLNPGLHRLWKEEWTKNASHKRWTRLSAPNGSSGPSIAMTVARKPVGICATRLSHAVPARTRWISLPSRTAIAVVERLVEKPTSTRKGLAANAGLSNKR